MSISGRHVLLSPRNSPEYGLACGVTKRCDGIFLRLPASQDVGSDLAASASSISSDCWNQCIPCVSQPPLSGLHSRLLYIQSGEISHGGTHPPAAAYLLVLDSPSQFSVSFSLLPFLPPQVLSIAACSGMLARTG